MENSRSGQRDVGFKFDPTDDELVLGYLLSKLRGKPLPSDEYVKECDVYGQEPWEICEKFRVHPSSRSRFWCEDDEGDLYVFTPLRKRSIGGSRHDRRVGTGGGYWHGEDAGKVSWSSDRKICWINKRFKYKSDGGRGNAAAKNQDGWIMHEYSLHKPAPWLGLDESLFDSYALCRIRKNEKKRKAAQGKNKVYYLEIDEEDDDDEVKGELKEIIAAGGGESNSSKQQEQRWLSPVGGGGAPAASPASSVGSAAFAASPPDFDPQINQLRQWIERSASFSSDADHCGPALCEEEQWEALRKAIGMNF
ncbi:unnamed protein product [Linum tenue]|uniref:NAC domain-containing protein n=1 Tax=Linum tenue TaxID=586396 RepID=A0AAV0PDI5_9ROSI|nr:unnamed protein product [Linum tenue]